MSKSGSAGTGSRGSAAGWSSVFALFTGGARRSVATVFTGSRRPSASMLSIGLLCAAGSAACAADPVWVEDSFEDFADGTLDSGGQNIYVSRDGTVRTVARFDLDSDGWIDLLFMNTHDMTTNAPPVLTAVDSARRVSSTPLAFSGAMQANIADLNKDGIDDFVFSPNPTGIQNPRLFLTVVYGGDDGWHTQRASNLLPVNGAGHYYRGNIVVTTIADLDADSWPDIVTLNSEAWLPGQPEGKVVRIYWGGAAGHLLTEYTDIGVRDAAGLISGDFDSDGAADIALLKTDNSVEIVWAGADDAGDLSRSTVSLSGPDANVIKAADIDNDRIPDLLFGTDEDKLHIIPGAEGRSFGEPAVIDAYQASHISVSDLDSDTFPDIVLSYFSLQTASGGELGAAATDSGAASRILWGSASGYDRSRATQLEADFLKASALGDYDGDGNADVALAIYQDETSFETESVIYYGDGNRGFELGSETIATEGAFCAETVAAPGAGADQVIFCSSRGGAVGERVPIYLYWGGPDGFTIENRTDIPFRSGNGATAADFDADGFVDLLANNSMHAKQTFETDPSAGANIFWGGPDGFDFSADVSGRTILKEQQLGTANVADFDKDGYLDIVLGQYGVAGEDEHVMIYYGSPDGYSEEMAVRVSSPGWSLGDIVADYDKDGWLDIAVMGGPENEFRIFYGSEDGFDESRMSATRLPWCVDLEAADLNNDGWLDMVAGTYQDVVNKHHDIGITIFWGGPDGYKEWNKMTLPGNTPIGSVIADFDSDGHLDIFNPLYHRDIDRENIPTYLFWGSEQGYDPDNRTVLFIDSSDDGLAADFDRDGKLDLAVVSHTKHDDHNTVSKVFYNDGNRFSDPRVEDLPTAGPHWMYNRDMGHIYDRSWQQTYVSSTFEWDREEDRVRLDYEADIPGESSIRFEVRSSHSRAGVAAASWRPLDDDGTSSLDRGDRFLQYKAVFMSDNGDRYPVLDKVEVRF